MNYKGELFELYKIAGMQRQLSNSTMQDMDLAYSSLAQVINKLDELGIKTYTDLDKISKIEGESNDN